MASEFRDDCPSRDSNGAESYDGRPVPPWAVSAEPSSAAASDGMVASGGPTPPWEVPSDSAPDAPNPEPKRGIAAFGHFCAWTLAIVGVFLVVLAVEIVVVLYGSSLLLELGRIEPDGGYSTFDNLLLNIAIQLIWLAIMVPWWLHVRRRGVGVASRSGRASASPGRVCLTVLSLALMGIGLQIVISLLLGIILPLFPEIEAAYDSMMENSGTNELNPLSVLTLAILAPIVEEVTFRGVAFQFALRAVTPAWSKRLTPEGYQDLCLSTTRFWVANVLQALAFGIMHLNITQGVYAFAIGLVLGWLYGRTGRLRYGVGLHLAINFASYFVNEALGVFALLGDFGVLVGPIACVAAGIALFKRVAPADGVLTRCGQSHRNVGDKTS